MSLIIAGLGIKFLSHLTHETTKILEESDKVFYLTNEELYPEWISTINKNTESLNTLYFSHPMRHDGYMAIKDKLLAALSDYNNVAFVIYGHPNFLVQASSFAQAAAKTAGHTVFTLPAISSLDCLLADLCINPGEGGMQILEATELLIYSGMIDISAHVVIFQAATIGQSGHSRDQNTAAQGLKILCHYLLNSYDSKHLVVFYEAAQYPKQTPKIIQVTLQEADQTLITSKTTLYIPPFKKRTLNYKNVALIESIV
jgi:tetrapyrrole methylase family protein/MazG family protein